jgi:hypothetical protein
MKVHAMIQKLVEPRIILALVGSVMVILMMMMMTITIMMTLDESCFPKV